MRNDVTRKPVIGLRQFAGAGNAYVDRNREVLSRLGKVVDVPRARRLALAILWRLVTFRRLKIYDVLIVNWAENVLTQWRGRLTPRGALEYRLYLWLCRRAARDLIYVRHNRVPHDVPTRYHARVIKLIEKGERAADRVVAHSPVFAAEHGYSYVPHPLYEVRPAAATEPVDEFVVFGRIRRYKKLDALIAAWGRQARLAIIGPCTDDAYLARLEKLAADKPVEFDIGFHDEAGVAARMSHARGVVVVNDPDSLIVSGTFFFAISAGARVFTAADPFYRWLADTPLGSYVSVFESVNALGSRAGHEPARQPGEPAAIRAAAEALFGDREVLAGWRQALAEAAGAR